MKAATDSLPQLLEAVLISIHAAREGGDFYKMTLSRLSVISIHAAREGGDNLPALITTVMQDFNPRRP